MINLEDIHGVAEVRLKKREHVFALITKQRTYYLQALSRADLEDWINPIRQSINRSTSHIRTRTKSGNRTESGHSNASPPVEFTLSESISKEKGLPPIPIQGSELELSQTGNALCLSAREHNTLIEEYTQKLHIDAKIVTSPMNSPQESTQPKSPTKPNSPELSPVSLEFEENVVNDPRLQLASSSDEEEEEEDDAINESGQPIENPEQDDRVILSGYLQKLGTKYKVSNFIFFVLFLEIT